MKKNTFKLKPFFLLNLGSILLLLSWSLLASREYWDVLDLYVFSVMDDSIKALGGWWHGFWALLSVRALDLLPLFLMLIVFWKEGAVFKRSERLSGLVGFVSLLVLMLFVREVLDWYIESAQLKRASPTALVEGAQRLSQLYPNLPLKDWSSDSFPGDHAAVLFVWLGYCLFFVRNYWSVFVLVVSVVFILPRLVAGAHWFSDVMVGGLSIALVTLSIGLYTPALNQLNKKLNTLTEQLLRRFLR